VEDILPPAVINSLRDHFYAGVTLAELGYTHGAGDEDSLTGALGQALFTPGRQRIGTPDGLFEWSTHYFKLRGRGAGAPEKHFGADGIFQLEVSDEVSGKYRKKGLLFQAKREWHSKDSQLVQQCERMRALESDSIVIDYSPRGYQAFDAGLVVAVDGKRAAIPTGSERRLAETLGDDFVRCRRGVEGISYDPQRELVVITPLVAGVSRQPRTGSVAHIVTTRVLRDG
jgi:hypothetical protein